MLGIGHFPELIIVLVIALIVFGPGKLPEIGRSLGKGLRGFQQASKELQSTLNGPFEDINAPITSSPPASTPQAGAGAVPVTTVEHLPDQSSAGGPAHVAEHAAAPSVVPTGTTVVKAEEPQHVGITASAVTTTGSSAAPVHPVAPAIEHEQVSPHASTATTAPVPPPVPHGSEPGPSAAAPSTTHPS